MDSMRLNNQTLSNQTLSNQTLSNQTLNNQTLSNQALNNQIPASVEMAGAGSIKDGNSAECGRVQEHRVGTITFGISMIAFGAMFLIHMFVPAVSYRFILSTWPCIFIMLGVEILLGSRRKKVRFTYDAAGIVLTGVMIIFAMCMAGCEAILQHGWM